MICVQNTAIKIIYFSNVGLFEVKVIFMHEI